MFKFFNKYNFSFNYDLGLKTWFGTGGKCLCFITSDSEREIRIILKYFKKIFPVFIIGAGIYIVLREIKLSRNIVSNSIRPTTISIKK